VDREGRADHPSQTDASEPISTKCGRARLGTHRSKERGELVTDSLSGEPEPISRNNARILAGHHKGSRQADKTAKGWALTAVAMQAQEGRREKDEKLTLHTAAQLISRTLMNDVDYRYTRKAEPRILHGRSWEGQGLQEHQCSIVWSPAWGRYRERQYRVGCRARHPAKASPSQVPGASHKRKETPAETRNENRNMECENHDDRWKDRNG